MAPVRFTHLNVGWNAEPNVPEPGVKLLGARLELEFYLNFYAYDAADWEQGVLTFDGCSAWRLGATNDHGWDLGQCRYSKLAPAWGEFYELIGEDPLRDSVGDWRSLPGTGTRHFLFYFRDETFECVADSWTFDRRLTAIA